MSDEPAPRAERRVVRALLLPVVALLALAGCEDPAPGGGRPPGDGGPGPRPPVQPPEGGGFTPTHERVVGFPALFRDSHPEEVREAEAEAGRVTAMHERGGTGRGQVVGTVESGANPDHPDLQGQFAHTCAMGRCDDGRPNRSDHSPLDDTDDHGTQVNGIVVASKNGLGMYGVAYEARIASYGNTAPTFPWVVGLGTDGRIGFFSHYCGAARAWCIAAPGEVVTTHRDGSWKFAGGTSMAAPYVAGALAALKSMAPYLSYHELRRHLLATADRSPPYDDAAVYGQGRLDLAAASRSISR